jgi:hypothetical protein
LLHPRCGGFLTQFLQVNDIAKIVPVSLDQAEDDRHTLA